MASEIIILSVIFCAFLVSVDCRGGHRHGGGHGHGGHGHSSFGGSSHTSLYSHNGHSYPSSSELSGSGSSLTPSHSYPLSTGLSGSGSSSISSFSHPSLGFSEPGPSLTSSYSYPSSTGLLGQGSHYIPSSSYQLSSGLPDFGTGSSYGYKPSSSGYPGLRSSSSSNSYVLSPIGWSFSDYIPPMNIEPSLPDLSGIDKYPISENYGIIKSHSEDFLDSHTKNLLNGARTFRSTQTRETKSNDDDDDSIDEEFIKPKSDDTMPDVQQTSSEPKFDFSSVDKVLKDSIANSVDMFKKSGTGILSSDDYIKSFLNNFDPKFWPEEYKTTSTTTEKPEEPSTTHGYDHYDDIGDDIYKTDSPEAGQQSTERYSTPSWQMPTDKIQDPELPSKDTLKSLLSKPPWWASIFIAV